MTPRLKRLDHEPPIGWCYQPFDDHPNFIVRAGTLNGLKSEVMDVFRANGRTPPENLAILIEEWICRRLPDSFCTHAEYQATRSYPIPTFAQITTRTESALRAYRVDRLRPGKDEVLQRASICLQCAENTSAGGCSGCNGLREWVAATIPQTVAGQARLYVCRRSGIMLQAMIHISNKALNPIAVPANYIDAPAACWRHPKSAAPQEAEAPHG